MRLTRPTTVDGVLGPLNRAIEDLERIKEDHRSKRASLLDQIRDLEEKAKAAGDESTRAVYLIGKVRDLIGDA